MKVFKFKKPKKIELSFFAEIGMDLSNGEFLPNVSRDIPPTIVEFTELTLVRFIDFLPRKLILADFLETVYPLTLWDKNLYKEAELNREDIFNRIQLLIDDEDNDYISPLFSVVPPQSLRFSREDFKEIEESEEYVNPIFQELFVIKPKKPILPPLIQRCN